MQKVVPHRVTDIKFYKDSAKVKIRPKLVKNSIPAASSSEQAAFLESIANTGQKVVALSCFKEYSGMFVSADQSPAVRLPACLRELFCPEMISCDKVSMEVSTVSSVSLNIFCFDTISIQNFS